jgi:hypothetical protein
MEAGPGPMCLRTKESVLLSDDVAVGKPYVTPFLSVWLFDCSLGRTKALMVSGVTVFLYFVR